MKIMDNNGHARPFFVETCEYNCTPVTTRPEISFGKKDEAHMVAYGKNLIVIAVVARNGLAYFFYQNDLHVFPNNIYNIKTIKIKETYKT